MTSTTRTARAIGYARVSTDRQADSGLGLDAQHRAIEAAARLHRLELVGIRDDAAVSGASGLEERPGLMDAVADLRRGDVLIVAKRDRLGRDVVAVAMIERLIERKGGRVLSASGEGSEGDDPSAVLHRGIADLFSQHERLMIGARTKAALKAKKARGERFSGRLPFGFRLAEDGRTLEPEPGEQSVIAAINDCREAGLSLRAIANELNGQGLTTRAGTAWKFEYVRNVLKAA